MYEELIELLRRETTCDYCKYDDECTGDKDYCQLNRDAADAIERLSAELEQVKQERDAAYKLLGGEPPKTCRTCTLWGTNGWGQYQVGYCEGDEHPHGPNDFCSRHPDVQRRMRNEV